MMPVFVQAGLWGLFSASGLTIGALLAVTLYGRLSHRVIAGVMGFGGGVLIAVVAVELMTEAYTRGDPLSAVAGLIAGGAVFSFINWRLAEHGAKNRNRCGDCVAQPRETDQKGSGLASAVGAGKLAAGVVAGFFLANIPQGLSSASGMRSAGRSRRYIFTVWLGIPVITAAAAALGALVLGSASNEIPAVILAFAAGAVLAMLAEAMIPEAFENAQPFIGLITVIGFLAAFLLLQLH